ncbi:asparagine synthase-related protein [Sphingomonas sp. LB-2]|uniref:asparagine synthetase B family protein n=1 Tax=Sphingomonas caeni TaxID=2984949 RepID=UPI002231EB84|nr:asparagine synthase-related protein [Sphingomonas caeni]MCW3848243.1 asparagine synthase-related protein [Sphingomonas caeni]
MSAIAGAVFADGRDMTPALLASMAEAMPVRGFDGISHWHDGPAGMIRFHHAATPEAVGEVQPLRGPSGAVIAFDGRLDNRVDLLALLGPRGAGLADAPDVAIALALFEARGEDFVQALVGDWAMAIWQPEPRRLFCARSPGGWRPFLWTFDGKTFGFATEPRALVVGLGLERRLNQGAIGEMMAARFVTNTETFWDGVQRLGQGGALAFEKGAVRTWQWHTGPFEDLSHLSETDLIDKFRETLDTALISAMRSNTAVSSHLSGGLDSSTVVARLTELHRAGRVASQVNAVTARFPGESQDETEWSQAVEKHLGIAARVTAADPYPLDDARRWTAETFQLPLRPNVHDTTTAAFRMLQQGGERVLLTGEGGDDWMAGNFGYLPDMLMRGDLVGLFRQAMTQFPAEPVHVRLRRTAFLAAAPVFSRSYRAKFLKPHLVLDPPMPDFIRADWAARIGLADRWANTPPPVDPPGFAQKQRYATFTHARRHIAHDTILAAAERHGVEMRHPLHDLRLANFFMGVPGWMLRRNGEKKYILREAMRGTLTEKVRTRQDKAVFITSLVDAIEDRFAECPPQQLIPARMGWIDGDRVEAMFAPAREWRRAGSPGPLTRTRIGPVWFIVAMDLWLEHAFGL